MIHTPAEIPLAHSLLYWWAGDGCLVLTDGSIVLGYSLATVSVVTAPDDELNRIAGVLRSALNSLPPGYQVQVLRRSRPAPDDLFTDFEASLHPSAPTLLREQRAHARQHLAAAGLRVWDSYLFVSRPRALAQSPASGGLRQRLTELVRPAQALASVTRAHHLQLLERVRLDASRFVQALAPTGASVRMLSDEECLRVAFALLNPGRDDQFPPLADSAPPVELPEANRPLYRALSLREQLAHSGVSVTPDGLFLGEPLRPYRVLCLKTLPRATQAAGIRLANRLPFPHWLSFSVGVPDSEAKFDEVDRRRHRAQAWATGHVRNVKADEQAAELEAVLREMTSRDQRMFNLSLSVLIGAENLVQLERRTSEALGLFSDAQLPLVTARLAQKPAYLGLLPGCSHRAPHPRTVLTDNAAHLFPLYDAWRGDARPIWLASTRNREPFALDIRNPAYDAWNATVFGRTGGGKSFLVNSLLTTSCLAQGGPVVVIDVGGGENSSYLRLCRALGGDFVALSLDGRHAINPFYPRDELFTTDDEHEHPSSTPNAGKLTFLVQLALLACQDPGAARATRIGERIVREAITSTYEKLAGRTPIFSDVADTLAVYEGEDTEDRQLARQYAKTLRAFLSGPAGRLLNQPTRVRLGGRFTVFDLKGLEALGDVATAVLYVVNAAVWNTLAPRGRKALAWVVYDETWKLMRHPTAAELQEELYRTARKLRAGVLSVTQNLDDFEASPASRAVLSNSLTTYLLRHKDGHERVSRLLGLNEVEASLFRSLDKKTGYFSEFLLKTERGSSVVRFSPSPFDYWTFTTDPLDKQLEAETLQRFHGDRLATLRHLASTYPNGAAAGAASPKESHAA